VPVLADANARARGADLKSGPGARMHGECGRFAAIPLPAIPGLNLSNHSVQSVPSLFGLPIAVIIVSSRLSDHTIDSTLSYSFNGVNDK
jgi:hypothetical protein